MTVSMDLPHYPPSMGMSRNMASVSMDFGGNFVRCVTADSGKDSPMTMSMNSPQYPASMGMDKDTSCFRRQTTDEHFRRQHTDEVDLEAEAMNDVNFIFGQGRTMPASLPCGARRPSFQPQAGSDFRRFHAGA